MSTNQALSFAIRTRRPMLRACAPSFTVQSLSRHLRTSTLQKNIHNARTKSQITTQAVRRIHTTSRPSLPFSSVPSRPRTLLACFTRYLQSRHITSHLRRKRFRDTFLGVSRIHMYFWPMFFLAFTFYIGLRQIGLEHEEPTPREWGFWGRWDMRFALERMRLLEQGVGSWEKAGELLENVLARVEEECAKEGLRRKTGMQGVGTRVEHGGEESIYDNSADWEDGFDLSRKSPAWKQGYFDALMAMAKVAEQLDGMCKMKGDKITGKNWRWENIPGPSNPRAVPLPWAKDGSHLKPPREQEVENVTKSPEVLYRRVLACWGFTNRQRLDACLAWADFAEYKREKEKAEELYDWSLDIAQGGLPEGSGEVVDLRSGVIQGGKDTFVSENVLKASTAYGTWKARRGEVREALPVFLSLLRARKALQPMPAFMQKQSKRNIQPKVMSKEEREKRKESDIMSEWFWRLKDFLSESKDTTNIKSSGDEPPYHTSKEACEEVGIMTYIGEILFATSEAEREKGLSWTRDSVEAAEAVLWFMEDSNGGNGMTREGEQRCRECLDTGLQNWKAMTRQMGNMAKKQLESVRTEKTWFGNTNKVRRAEEEVRRWDDEQTQIDLKLKKTASLVHPLRTPQGGLTAMI